MREASLEAKALFLRGSQSNEGENLKGLNVKTTATQLPPGTSFNRRLGEFTEETQDLECLFHFLLWIDWMCLIIIDLFPSRRAWDRNAVLEVCWAGDLWETDKEEQSTNIKQHGQSCKQRSTSSVRSLWEGFQNLSESPIHGMTLRAFVCQLLSLTYWVLMLGTVTPSHFWTC